ncbi:MAG TPA: hypothetical protein PKD67_14710 [Ignavibacteriaceae bacterium]|nr:hypothetical protein [Ignavibacteriaceae bacterium]
MKTIPESIKKFILIGLSLFLFKSVLLAYAYAFNPEQYNLFNQSYYTASLLILFGSLGFNISQTRLPVKTTTIFFFITVNTIITYFILHLISKPFQSIEEIIPIIVYSVFVAAGGVLNFKLLFDGKYQKYFWVMLIFAAAHFMIIPAVLFFNVSIFTFLALFTIIWFIIVFKLFDTSISVNKSYSDYYKIGFSAFVINSAVSLGLAGDKFIVNHFFATDIANAYTFAWSLTAPIFYIGNMIEKYLFAEQKPDKTRILKKGFLFSVILISIYSFGIIIIITFFPELLPDSISKEIFKQIFIFMITGYSVYVIFHFPLNTYLFKVIETSRQKTISIYFSFIILLFAGVFYYIINYATLIDYRTLLITVWIYIFILLIVKAVIIFKGKVNYFKRPDDIITDEIQEIP